MAAEVPPPDAAHDRATGDDAAARLRIGFGQDRHPFGPGEPLRLGGIDLPGAPRLHGHSDGDVALHAIADAILGGASLGDLGRLAPSDARTPRGIASETLLRLAHARAREAGWSVAGVDVTITGARPRFGDRLDAMAAAIAGALEVPSGAVSVKASTGNLQGPEGEGRAISAEAVVTLAAAGPAAR
jgi:2-C-methyl-D-erythritol 2,4-cyclodiphosphate synthase